MRLWYLSERPSVCRYSVVVPVKLPEIPKSVDGEATDIWSRGKGRGVKVFGSKISAPHIYSQRALSTKIQQTTPVGVCRGRHQQVHWNKMAVVDQYCTLLVYESVVCENWDGRQRTNKFRLSWKPRRESKQTNIETTYHWTIHNQCMVHFPSLHLKDLGRGDTTADVADGWSLQDERASEIITASRREKTHREVWTWDQHKNDEI